MISLDLQDDNQTCPLGWTEITDPVRTCTASLTGCVAGFEETVQRPFTRVAGRAIGYQVGTTEAFSRSIVITSLTADSQYVDGLSVTHSETLNSTNNHIWTFACGVTETDEFADRFTCPCARGIDTPAFVGENYFCESGNPTTSLNPGFFYQNDPLWDGENCEGQCCIGSFASVPMFCAIIDEAPLNSILRVRNCQDEPTSTEGIAVEFLEIFVQ